MKDEMKDDKILLCSNPKTGQHWILFFLAYYTKLVRKLDNPINWYFISQFSKISLDPIHLAHEQPYLPKYPHLIRIEYSRAYSIKVRNFFESFDKKIYLYRNPADVMISFFFFFMRDYHLNKLVKTKINLKRNAYFRDFVEFNLIDYVTHVEVSIDHCDLVLCYDELRKNNDLFKPLLLLFFDDIDEDAFQKALQLSSFESIKSMERKEQPENENFIPYCRNGHTGQYESLMSKEMIEYIYREWNELKKRIKYKLT